jgi:hypothetical protein
MSEYECFQVLQEWMKATGGALSIRSVRGATAVNLAQHKWFEKIDPMLLTTTVAASGLL